MQNEYDYLMSCDKKEELFGIIKECYYKEKNMNLPIYGIPGHLDNHRTTKKDISKGTDKLPLAKYRLIAEDTFQEAEEVKEVK